MHLCTYNEKDTIVGIFSISFHSMYSILLLLFSEWICVNSKQTDKRLVKVKQEQVETRADLEDVRDDLDIANETVTQQAVFTDAWQSKFDELGVIAQAAGVDGKIISEIRNRSITNGSS